MYWLDTVRSQKVRPAWMDDVELWLFLGLFLVPAMIYAELVVRGFGISTWFWDVLGDYSL